MPSAARGEPMPGNGDRSRTPEGVFGKAPKFHRERAGLSQTELAGLSNYSNTVISKIENGDRPPAEGFPGRMDAIPQLGTHGELERLWGWLEDSARHPRRLPRPDGRHPATGHSRGARKAMGVAGRQRAAPGLSGVVRPLARLREGGHR